MSKNSKTANRATGLGAAKIRSIVSVPLVGESPKGGWSAEIRPEDSIHSLIAVHTDAGITGHGSVFTNGGLVAAALKVLAPLFEGENALEPERVSEKLHQNS
ncbi:MAG: mandelate racemase/muconate lactonizing enzyme family protein, partial [Dongiales bacterium]